MLKGGGLIEATLNSYNFHNQMMQTDKSSGEKSPGAPLSLKYRFRDHR